MINSIIPAVVAEKMNEKVQKEIDPRLFLSCNYEPTRSYVISDDAKYLTAIQDLYKFAIDSSGIINRYKYFLSLAEHRHFDSLRDVLDLIGVLRAVVDHNHNERNGKIEQAQLDRYSSWIKKCIQKDTPETMEDFCALNLDLKKLSDKLLFEVDRFIDYICKNKEKSAIINTWISQTLYWYSHSTKVEIYKGQLMNTYVANAHAINPSNRGVIELWSLNRKVGKWIRAALFYPIDCEVQKLQSQIDSLESWFDRSNMQYEKMRARMSPEKAAELDEQFRNSINQYSEKQAELEQEKKQLEEKIGTRHIDFFFNNLGQYLRETMEELDKNGDFYTLLPQDLMQEHIARFFKGVPSPEGDF